MSCENVYTNPPNVLNSCKILIYYVREHYYLKLFKIWSCWFEETSLTEAMRALHAVRKNNEAGQSFTVNEPERMIALRMKQSFKESSPRYPLAQLKKGVIRWRLEIPPCRNRLCKHMTMCQICIRLHNQTFLREKLCCGLPVLLKYVLRKWSYSYAQKSAFDGWCNSHAYRMACMLISTPIFFPHCLSRHST